LQPLLSQFPLYEENLIFFFISARFWLILTIIQAQPDVPGLNLENLYKFYYCSFYLSLGDSPPLPYCNKEDAATMYLVIPPFFAAREEAHCGAGPRERRIDE
jgi:hypothetical protein